MVKGPSSENKKSMQSNHAYQNQQEGPNVKGHSGVIYRGPLMLSTKYW